MLLRSLGDGGGARCDREQALSSLAVEVHCKEWVRAWKLLQTECMT